MRTTLIFLIVFLAGHYLGDIVINASKAAYHKIAAEVQEYIPE
jgi:hypothetical protein